MSKLSSDRHGQASSSCGDLYMVEVTDAIICHKPEEGRLGNRGHARSLNLREIKEGFQEEVAFGLTI